MDTTASLLSELPSLLSSTPGSPRPASPVAPTVPTETAIAANLARKLMEERRKSDKEAKKETARLVREEAERNKPPVLPPFRVREWVDIPPEEGETVSEGKKVSIFSWNMLAQALVKRDLFPNSDFLKSKDRVPALMKEVVHYSPDVVCLQEVDRLSDHLPILSLTHSHSTFTGYPSKSHCLLLASKNSLFTQVKSRGFRLDELPIDDSGLDESDIPSSDPTSEVALATPGSSTTDTPPLTESGTSTPLESVLSQAAIPGTPTTRKSIGLSRSTRNVALVVALKFKDREGGIVVATTHLYWHPMFCYERVRQIGVLMREVRRFRDCADEGAYKGWEVVVAGDFNTQPREITYQLLLRNTLSSTIIGDLTRSRVVHQSVDKFYDPSYVPPVEEESIKKAAADSIRGGDLSQHPDKVIRNSRMPEEGDGLAELEELKRLFGYGDSATGGAGGGEIRSAYGENYGKIESEESNTYIDRTPEVASGSGWVIKEDPEVVRKRKIGTREEKIKRGDWEPKWTNFTPLWRCTLDYIFILPPSASTLSQPDSTPPPIVRSLLAMHPTEAMGAGLPKKGVEPSDHVAVGAVLEIF